MRWQKNGAQYVFPIANSASIVYVNDALFTGVDAYTKGETDALLSGSLNVAPLQSTGNIETATTLKTNNFENYNDNNITFSHNGLNYMGFNKDTGTILEPNNDASLKTIVLFESSRTIKTLEGLDS